MRKILILLVFAVSSIGLLALMNGCESTPASEKPEITPSAATIRLGDAVEFRASGGFEYTWKLQNETLGRLDTRRGDKVVYRSMVNPATNSSALQILTVISVIDGASSTTNKASYERTAEAYITHLNTNS